MKTIAIIYFSPTGNTAFLAKHLSSMIDGSKLYNIHDSAIEEICEEEVVVMSSIHAFSVSKIITKYIDDLLQFRKRSKIHIISVGCTTASINDAASIPIQRIVEKYNVPIGIDRVLAMPLTLVYKFPLETGKKHIVDSLKQLGSIKEDIYNDVIDNRKVSKVSKGLRYINVIERNAARLFGLELYASKECIKCSKCINECPTKNIRYNKLRNIKVSTKCMLCLNCIYTCPVNAMKPRVSRFIPLKSYLLDEYYNSK